MITAYKRGIKMSFLNKKIGIIGGGQLGKMMILEAKKMGFYVAMLDPNKECSASSIVDKHFVANFDDTEAILALAREVDVLTYEFEHISVAALYEAEKIKPIYPAVKSLETIQNKYTQNQALQNAKIPIPRFENVESAEDIKNIAKKWGYPLMLKAAKGGYDGKGNFFIKNDEAAVNGFEALGAGKILLVVEEFVDFTMEISVLTCRSIAGDVVIYPIAENIHRNEILNETIVPARVSEDIAKKAKEVATAVMQLFEGVGMFGIEMFVTRSGEILVNEIAPRPHNSGHFSIEACQTSQFMNHIRAITGLPLGSTELLSPVAMRNILGDLDESGKALVQGTENALKIPGVAVHIYGKKIVKPKGKMGHITALAKTPEEASEKANKANDLIKILGV